MRLDPDVVAPSDLLAQLKEIEASLDTEHVSFSTRVIDVPAYYDDPWTREVLMRFRDNHQAPEGTDLEYVTRINGFKTEQEFIEAHHGSPYYVSMVGFVPGLPWCFQMVGPERQLEVPKYLTPRTDTPALALSHGGAFAAIYPVQGPGGYQLFAMCPVPIFDPEGGAAGLPGLLRDLPRRRHPQDPARSTARATTRSARRSRPRPTATR